MSPGRGRTSRSASGRMTTHVISADPPYRLDLTVAALRRNSINVVDVYARDGRYLRAFRWRNRPVVVSVTQPRRDALTIRVEGPASGTKRAVETVRRMLGADLDLAAFHRKARSIPWLAPIARRMRGLKPPRYPEMFEACANAILFQQVSLRAASTIMRRFLMVFDDEIEHDGIPLVVFPSAERFLEGGTADLRAAGLSANKLATLRRAGEAIVAGELTAAMVEARPSEDASLLLQSIKGIGPWTAAVILLRGFGRVDVFPGNDTGVQANLVRFAGRHARAAGIIEGLGSERGMLYFTLLLARLEQVGEIGKPSDVVP